MRFLLLMLLMSTPIDDPPPSSLPDIEVLRGIRAARIAHMEGDHVRERQTLKGSYDKSPEDMSLLHALLVHHRIHAVLGEEADELQTRLIRLLDDPSVLPTISVLSLVLGDEDLDSTLLNRVAAHLDRRTQGAEPDADLLELLTFAYTRLKDSTRGLETLERLVAIEPTTYRRWRLVYAYRKAERWQDAANFVGQWIKIEKAANLRSAYVDLLSRAGQLDLLTEQVELLLAEQQATRAAGDEPAVRASHLVDTQSNPLRVGMWVVRTAAWNLRDAGKDEAAERFFHKVLELDPEDQEVRNALLYLYGSEEELQALEHEAKARWQQEEDPNALFEEGTQRLTAGDAESALELLKKAAPGLAHLEPAWYNLGMAAYRVEDWATVAEAFGKASELNPERSQSFFYRGLALEKLGSCSDAVVDLEKALELDAGRHLAHYYLAACYARLGQPAKAKSHRALYDAAN